ncbi:MAG: hypothetical protein U9Q92_06035 [archaeon]|nr:hypothetical protein [archaeon]
MDKCPACARKFETLKDFPIVFIARFKKLKLPEIIGSQRHEALYTEKRLKNHYNVLLPKHILKLFQNSRKDVISHEGIAYRKLSCFPPDEATRYESSEDVTDIVKKAAQSRRVQNTLTALESFRGKEVLTKNLLALPGFKKFTIGKYKDVSLSLFEEERQNSMRVCRLYLSAGWGRGHLRVASISVDLAQIEYVGRVNA